MKIPDIKQNVFASLPCGTEFHEKSTGDIVYIKTVGETLENGMFVNAVNKSDGALVYFFPNNIVASIGESIPSKVEFDKLHSGDTFYCDETIYIKISNPNSSYYEAVDLQTGKIYRFAFDSRVYPANVHIENDK